jgi:hypothetical protein
MFSNMGWISVKFRWKVQSLAELKRIFFRNFSVGQNISEFEHANKCTKNLHTFIWKVVRQEVPEPEHRGTLRLRLRVGRGPRRRQLHSGTVCPSFDPHAMLSYKLVWTFLGWSMMKNGFWLQVPRYCEEARARDLAAGIGCDKSCADVRRHRQEERHWDAQVSIPIVDTRSTHDDSTFVAIAQSEDARVTCQNHGYWKCCCFGY